MTIPISSLLHKSLTDLVRAPGRTLVILLSILIAVFLFSAVNSSETTLINAFATPGYGLQESGYDHYASLLRVIALVGVVLASLLIISTVTALMTEQVQIIGLLKALGGTRLVIMRSYLVSIGIAAIIGTLGGIALGVPVGYAVAVVVARNTVIRGFPPLVVDHVIVTPGLVALSLFIGLGIPCGAALYPLWQGTRLTVREAMSTYGLSNADERGSRQQVSTSWGILDLQEVEAPTQVYQPRILSGRWFLPNEQDVLLLNDTAANIMHRTVGETLIFTDRTVLPGHTTTWKIIGIVHDDSVARGGAGVALTTPENFHRFYGLTPDEVDGGVFIQSRQHDPHTISMLIAQLLRTLNHPGMAAGMVSYQDFTRLTLGPGTQFQLALFYVVSAFVALISLFTLIMVQIRSVMERKREIGVMRALGARGWQVAIVFWVVAILFSVPAAYGFLQLFLSSAVQSYVPFAYNTGFLPVMLASIGPIRRATRMRVKELLRYE